MQKIGLHKCSDRNVRYSKKIFKDEFICIDGWSLSNISSTIINSFILQTEFIDSVNAVRLFLKIVVKIIYSKSTDSSLYVYEKEIFTTEYIDLPNTIDGFIASKTFLKKKINPELFIENITVKNLNNIRIILNFCIVANLKITPSFYFCYNINNGLFDNIFLSYPDGKNLVQKTFKSDLEYMNIKYQPDGKNIVVVGKSAFKSSIYVLSANNENEDEINCININKNVNSFNFINTNKIVLSLSDNDGDQLYIANLKTNEVKKIIHKNLGKNYTSPYFDSNFKILYFLCVIENIRCLCCIDSNDNFDILFNFINVDDYVVSYDGEKIILKIKKDNKYQLYILNLSSRLLEPINLDFDYEEIFKISFLGKAKSNESILILYNYNGLKYLSSYNLKTLESSIIISNDIINDFTVDTNTVDIFVVYRSKNFTEVIRINNNNKEYLFKIPSDIKQICVR